MSIGDDEDVKLRPMSLSDRPNKKKSLARISALLAETDDSESWADLSPFLEGMKQSKEPVPHQFLEQLARNANMLGTHRFILECADHPDKTDVRLSKPFFTRELLLGCHERAADAGFEGKELASAAKQVEHIAFMLEKDGHCGQQSLPDGCEDMRRSLFTNAVILEMAAAKALCFEKGRDIDGSVARNVAKVLTLSRGHSADVGDFTMSEFEHQNGRKKSNTKSSVAGQASHRLENLLPLWSGMKFAIRVPGAVPKADSNVFDRRMQALDEQVAKAEREVRELFKGDENRRGLLMLAKLREIHS